MATRSLGTLTLDLIAKIGGFTAGMDQASRVADKRMREIERRANAFGSSIGKSIKSAGAQFLAFAGVTLTVGAAFEGLKGAIDRADELRDLSIRLGTSTEVLSAFGYAAAQTGTDMDSLSKGMKILAKNAADAINPTSAQAKVFDALGISVTDSAGNLKQLGVLIPEIADKFKGLEDGTTKAALAQALFGKSGLDLTEFLNQGSDGLKTFGDRARELGIIVGTDAANAADKFNDDLNDLKTAAEGLALKVAQSLMPELDKLVTWATGFVVDGGNAAATAGDIASGFDQMAQAGKSIGQIVTLLEGLRDVMNTIDSFSPANLFPTTVGDFLKTKFPALYANPGGSKQQLSQFKGPASLQLPVLGGQQFNATTGNFNATAGTGRTQSNVNASALAKALSNPSAPSGGKHAKAGKSDAEREAEQVKRAIEQMTKAQQDWEAEVAKTGNPIVDEYSDKLRQITEDGKNFAKDGVPADKVKAFTDQMTALATTVRDSEIVKFQQEFDDQTAEMAAHMQGPAAEALQTYREEVRKLDELLKTGAITITEYNARLKELGVARDSPMEDVNKSIEEQIRLLGMSADQQEVYNNLKAAGVDANSAWGESIIANTEQLQKLREQTAFMEDVKASLSDAFGDFITGAKSAKDAFGDFADHVYQTALRWLADKAIQALFNGFGNGSSTSGATGSTGGGFDWGSLLSSFFGGGKAGGGAVTPGKFYEVGEYNRPEMLMSGGKQYMIPGNKGNVVPMGGGGGGSLTVNFAVQGRMTRETQSQAANRVARTQRLASARNS